jgi:hypothetical protein
MSLLCVGLQVPAPKIEPRAGKGLLDLTLVRETPGQAARARSLNTDNRLCDPDTAVPARPIPRRSARLSARSTRSSVPGKKCQPGSPEMHSSERVDELSCTTCW